MSAPRVIKLKQGHGNSQFTARQRLRCTLKAAVTASRNKKTQPSMPTLRFLREDKS